MGNNSDYLVSAATKKATRRISSAARKTVKACMDFIDSKTRSDLTVADPIESDGFGLNLEINNLTCTVCCYDCLYCSFGPKTCITNCRNMHVNPYSLYNAVGRKLDILIREGKNIDTITLAPHGEPTLDCNLADQIRMLRQFGYKIAVVSNSAHIWNDRVKENLMFADIVSLKVDTVDEEIWLKLNRPHPRLSLDLILQGIREFSAMFTGKLITGTMLVKNINDSVTALRETVSFLKEFPRDTSHFFLSASALYGSERHRILVPEKDSILKIREYLEGNIAEYRISGL